MTSVGVIGASGYTGAELLRLLGEHPGFEVDVATGDTMAGTSIAELYPSLGGRYRSREFERYTPEAVARCDLVFLGLPHGASQQVVAQLAPTGIKIVDLAADFRLDDADQYRRWYGEVHAAPELLSEFVYGLPEVSREELRGATRVAVPGCYPTAAILALAPFVHEGVLSPEALIVDAASGVSGAGRAPKPNTTFCAVDEDFTAYSLLEHRHTPEIEQALCREVLFTPHLAPMSRGILATCHARCERPMSTADALALLAEYYAEEPFVSVLDQPPSTKATLGSNSAHLTARVDDRNGQLVTLCAIDNLVKGASGQAIQCANLICGLDEAAGLPLSGLYP
ncbi:MAG: N-acetyl-gamma-glutamyl-phosphate reductase [Acidimicrobiales bacterium]|nr:MAG: N-acetyl-gamma-glutamyl-phosphate reductase [Actinomycetota bacterium]MBV6507107.1 N-acetyl-gamma-glutamyl-phosphate reductase [Acidimicrobiales bacterium]RIK05590.1 MAG: N-acetyl-gamma-glutamyl-phosphate reductase [Acidobacteriota bacterium]